MKYFNLITFLVCILTISCTPQKTKEGEFEDTWRQIEVSENGRFFQYENGDPFFWLGDTGWLIFRKLDRNSVDLYLTDRAEKGYNVIQVMGLHHMNVNCFNGVPALVNENVSTPNILPGDNPNDTTEYDYWDHVEYTIDLAKEKGLFIGFVPIWGSPVSEDRVTPEEVKTYIEFLYERFGDKPNIVWLNGGDVRGDDHMDVWKTIGETLDSLDNEHLITFHPRGRRMSSEWFHDEPWLDFDMFQSGHRTYDQDTARDSHRFGPDNWKYVDVEYNKTPVKPTLDGEPSYEGIPYGLHDANNPYWEAPDLRRYAYWSVFAGGAGFTYGHNSVMQFYQEGDENLAFGAREFWQEAIDHPGAGQMQHLKQLLLSKPYFERVPDQGLIADQGERYEYQAGTKGKDYAMIYTFTGRDVTVNMGRISGEKVKASWFNPSTGKPMEIGEFENKGTQTFDPTGEPDNGNDWVLVLESI